MPVISNDPLLHVANMGDQLIVRKRRSPVRSKLLLIVIFLTLLSFILAAYIIAARFRSGLWIYVVIAGLTIAALAERALILRSNAQKDEFYRFDKRLDRIEKNGEILAVLSEVDHILVRHIRTEDEDLKDTDLALVIALDDTRRLTIADSTGVPDKRGEIESAADELAGYVGNPVKQGTRRVTEWWLDQ